MIVIDTNILVEHLRGNPVVTKALSDLREVGEELGTTSICAAELLRGAFGSRRRQDVVDAHDLLDTMVQVPFGPRAARRFGLFMSQLDSAGLPLSTADGFIAACALEEGGRLMSKDEKAFARVVGLEVLTP